MAKLRSVCGNGVPEEPPLPDEETNILETSASATIVFQDPFSSNETSLERLD